MTDERDERMVAALESIAASLARLEKPVRDVTSSNYSVATEWPAAWSMRVASSSLLHSFNDREPS